MDDIHTNQGHEPEENLAVSYERTDLDIFAVLKFGVGLAIGTVVAVVAMWGLFEFLKTHQTEALVDLPPSVIEARKQLLPPEPRLQTMGDPHDPVVARGDLRSPHVELEKLRQDEAMQLQSYAWVDPDKGIVRIPVEEAKELVLKKGLPVKVTPDGEMKAMTANPGESVGTSSAAQPQEVYTTGAAAIGSAQVTTLPEAESAESAEKK